MRTSSNEIYIDGTYYSNNPHWGIEDAHWKAGVIHSLLQKHKIDPDEVIEVGCGSGAILSELSKVMPQTKFTGYDISPQAFAIASARESDRIRFINEDLTQQEYVHTEVLLMIDVLEHVDDYYGMLRHLNGKAGKFVFHIPLDLSCRTILKPHVLKQQRTSVGHIHYFSREMVEWMLKDTGYEIIDWVYTKPVVDVKKSDSFSRRIKKILRNFSFSLNKHLSAKLWGNYSMMILAKQAQ